MTHPCTHGTMDTCWTSTMSCNSKVVGSSPIWGVFSFSFQTKIELQGGSGVASNADRMPKLTNSTTELTYNLCSCANGQLLFNSANQPSWVFCSRKSSRTYLQLITFGIINIVGHNVTSNHYMTVQNDHTRSKIRAIHTCTYRQTHLTKSMLVVGRPSYILHRRT